MTGLPLDGSAEQSHPAVSPASPVAVITGAGGDVGRYIVRRFHVAGYRTVLVDLPESGVVTVAEELDPSGWTCLPVHGDMSSRGNVQTVLDQVTDTWGTPAVLVNNAAVTEGHPWQDVGTGQMNHIMTVNSASVFHGTQVFGAAMCAAGFGRIINHASLAAHNGGIGPGAHYAVSKAPTLTITKLFARIFADRGVTVNAVSPGPLDVPIVRRTIGDGMAAALQGIAVGRLGSADYLARVIVHLARPEASFVTGACWDFDGGNEMR